MNINFNFTLTAIDGVTPMLGTEEASNAGKILGNNLYQSSSSDPIKACDMARKIYNGNELELDKSDTAFLKDLIVKSQLINGIKEQLLEKFSN